MRKFSNDSFRRIKIFRDLQKAGMMNLPP